MCEHAGVRADGSRYVPEWKVQSKESQVNGDANTNGNGVDAKPEETVPEPTSASASVQPETNGTSLPEAVAAVPSSAPESTPLEEAKSNGTLSKAVRSPESDVAAVTTASATLADDSTETTTAPTASSSVREEKLTEEAISIPSVGIADTVRLQDEPQVIGCVLYFLCNSTDDFFLHDLIDDCFTFIGRRSWRLIVREKWTLLTLNLTLPLTQRTQRPMRICLALSRLEEMNRRSCCKNSSFAPLMKMLTGISVHMV